MCRENLIDFSNYIVYEDGSIFSIYKNKFITGTENKDGYIRVYIKCTDNSYRGFLVHRLVYFYFKGEIPDDMKVNHIDENHKNNSLSNLNLLTHQDNCNWGTRNQRISNALKGRKVGSPSDETKNKMSESQKRRFEIEKPWNKGQKNCFSDETINKMRKSHKHTPVIQIDNNEIVGRFEGLMEVYRELGIDPSSIMRCCKGKQKTAGGFQWKYE